MDPHLIGAVLLSWSGRIAAAVLIFFIGRMIAKGLTAWARRAFHRVGVDETLSRFFGSLINMVLLVLIVLTAVTALGVPTTNFLAILGAAGLAVGLALKDSLSNLAAGVMLVFFQPFRVGDAIEAAGVSGTVEDIGAFNTIVKSPDNRTIIVPNSLLYAGTIVNSSREALRRIDLVIPISYEDDVAKAKELLRGLVAADKRILDAPAGEIVVDAFAPSSVNIAVRVWVKSSDYGAVRGDLLEQTKHVLEQSGLSLSYMQQQLHVMRRATNDAAPAAATVAASPE
jgi:small conductance mechanosensitive channel